MNKVLEKLGTLQSRFDKAYEVVQRGSRDLLSALFGKATSHDAYEEAVETLRTQQKAYATLCQQLSEQNRRGECNHEITKIVNEYPDLPLEGLLEKIVKPIAAAMRYPKAACARIVLVEQEKRQEFQTDNFQEAEWKYSVEINANGKRGFLELCYLEKPKNGNEKVFLLEEEELIDDVGVRIEKMIERKLAKSEVKTLRGILPICSFCKKIRDDQNQWVGVDVYIQEHSEADCSHSLCPGCAKKHYPDLNLFGDDDEAAEEN